MRAGVLALGLLLYAPYQCGTEPNERATEDSAPKALYMLAERFREANMPEARGQTLAQLVEHYPSSRYAKRARVELSAQPDGERDAGQ